MGGSCLTKSVLVKFTQLYSRKNFEVETIFTTVDTIYDKTPRLIRKKLNTNIIYQSILFNYFMDVYTRNTYTI